jgi:hypothetical protein
MNGTRHPALSSLVNLLYTTTHGYEPLKAQRNVAEWRYFQHLVEYLPANRLANYLRFDTSSSLALIDAIVCSANGVAISIDKNMRPRLNYPLERAMVLSWDVRDLPESCAMHDGKKWRSIPFIIFYSPVDHHLAEYAGAETHAHLVPAGYDYAQILLMQIKTIVKDFHQRVLADYQYCGMLVRFENGRAQIRPALKRKNPEKSTGRESGWSERGRKEAVSLRSITHPSQKCEGWGTRAFCGCSKNRWMGIRWLERGLKGKDGLASPPQRAKALAGDPGSLDNPPFAITLQRMGHPDFVGGG